MITVILIWNIIVFFMYGVDKFKAIKNMWRISEKVLVLSALLLGGVGALVGMELFHHKTKHLKFRIIIPVSFMITIVVSALLYVK